MAANTERGNERDMALLRQRAATATAFKTRVNLEGMTRPRRSPVKRAFLEEIGASMPFRESGTSSRTR